ncbi:MAG: extracellular solute-binding protein [Clostridia bacterium]|nr:extracellular solute-binding protein [Clostridia bacterium]
MKKLMAVALSLSLAVGTFAGCGGKEEAKKKAKADSDDKVITIWSTEAAAQVCYEGLVDEWNASEGDEKNIFIDYVTTTDSQQIDVAQQNGQLPHIFSASGNQREKFTKLGDVAAINDLPGGEEFLKDFDQEPTEGDNLIDGKVYWIYPTVRTAGLVYNKDLFKKAGIVDKNGEPSPPETLSEVVEYAKKITALGGGVYGFAFPLGWGTSYTVTSPLSSYYKTETKESSQSFIDLDTFEADYSNYKEQFQWILDMEKDGSLFPGAMTLNNDNARAYFSSGIIGMIPAISWDVGVYTDQFPAECDWAVCQYPAPDGRELNKHWNQRGASMIISKKAAEKDGEAVMEVFKFLYSLETRTAIFEAGINLSMKTDVLENYDKDKVDPHFAQFAQFVDETNRYAKAEAFTIEGDGWATLFQKIWMGEMTIDAAIKDIGARASRDLKKAVAKGDYDAQRQKRVRRYLNGEDGLDLSMTH